MKTKGNKTSKVITIGSSPKWRGDKEVTMSREERKAFMNDQKPRRYSIHSDGDHKYFVEVGMEGEFEAWIDSELGNCLYQGHDYEKNRIDGRFTFTDPRCE